MHDDLEELVDVVETLQLPYEFAEPSGIGSLVPRRTGVLPRVTSRTTTGARFLSTVVAVGSLVTHRSRLTSSLE
ncbi:hypothetical protein [Tenggerimyces flavus]|uniref:Uncharacterized protein n=1 Tax=Tenggerimyces flavus TaxID=1708749 RepID=A0ABV7YJZ7_9ACTN|nr:hypothetical protein [Tenggerimyces flavus]